MVLAALASWAFAAPPPGADPALAPWFRSLQQPGTGWGCCSIADCRPVRYRMADDHYEAFIDRQSFGANAPDQWEPVPPDHVIRTADNPTGEAVACWYAGEIRCFVEASAS